MTENIFKTNDEYGIQASEINDEQLENVIIPQQIRDEKCTDGNISNAIQNF